MAISRKETKVIQKNVVVLEMSQEEANTLRSVLQHISGSPTNSRRRDTDAIEKSLKGLTFADNTDIEGAFFFNSAQR